MPGQQAIKEAVLDQDWCSGCGMCVGLCPYIKTARERVCTIYPCGLTDGTCYRVCPKLDYDIQAMDEFIFGRTRDDQALGVYRDIYVAKAVSGKAPRSQNGGVATTLAAFALEQGLVSAMALTGGDALNPRPVLAQSAGQVADCAGSKYTPVPTLAAFNLAVQKNLTAPGVVGRPCQIQAVRKMTQSQTQGSLPGTQYAGTGSVGILIGLFCFCALNPQFYDFLNNKIQPGEKIIKIDIPVDGPIMTTDLTTHRWSLDDMRPYYLNACNFCLDPTSETADIAVGGTEYKQDWNTVIVRSEQGQALWELALQKNIIECEPYPPDRLPLLRQANLNKKMRVLENPAYIPGQPGCPTVTPDYLKQMREQWGGMKS